MKNVVYNVIKDELNWREKMVVKIFSKTFNKLYNIGRIHAINNILR